MHNRCIQALPSYSLECESLPLPYCTEWLPSILVDPPKLNLLTDRDLVPPLMVYLKKLAAIRCRSSTALPSLF